MPCVFSCARLHSLPSALKQLVCVAPSHLAAQSEALVLYLQLVGACVYYSVEDRVSDCETGEERDGLRRGEIGVDGEAGAVVPGLVESQFFGEEVHVRHEDVVVGAFTLLLLVSLDDLAHRFSDCNGCVIAAGQHQSQQQLVNSKDVSVLQLSSSSRHFSSPVSHSHAVVVSIDSVLLAD